MYGKNTIRLLLALFASSLILLSTGCANPFIKPYGYITPEADTVWGDGRPVVMSPNAPSIPQGFMPKPRENRPNEVHEGIDIYAQIGTAVLAAAPGVVLKSYYEPFYGHHVVINHGEDENNQIICSRYLHLGSRAVKTGDRVKRGQKIGTLGRTGLMALFPHLHYEVRIGPSLDALKARDPHKFWADGVGVVTCFDTTRRFADTPFQTTYPVVCRNVDAP